MGLSVSQSNSSYSRVLTKQSEYSGRLAIQKSQRFKPLEIEHQNIFPDCENLRNTSNRPICFLTEPSVTKIHALASRPRQLCSRFPSALLEKPIRVCIPSILLNRKGTCQSEERPVSSSYHNISMANSAMVRSITLSVGSISHNSTQSDHIVTRPSGAKHLLQEGNQLQSVTWKVSGKPWKVREYENSLPLLTQIPEGQGQYLVTNRPGESGLAGVVNGRLIPLQVVLLKF